MRSRAACSTPKPPAFVNGAPGAAYTLLHAVGAFRDGADGVHPKVAGQIVQYVSAHDNFTLWDKLKCVAGRRDFAAPDADLLAQNRLCAAICLTCQGLPFLQAGEEFARTKNGDPNTYRGPLALNRLDWPAPRSSNCSCSSIAACSASAAPGRSCPPWPTRPSPSRCCWRCRAGLSALCPSAPTKAAPAAWPVYYNPENVPHTVALPAGNWRTVCDGVTASPQPFGPVRSGQIELPPVSAVILAAQAAPGG